MPELRNKEQTAKIEKGEVISYCVDGHEFIHSGDEPGWGHSDTEMFPIIGPTAEAGFRVHVPRGNAILDQHGLLRELEYKVIEHSNSEIILRKEYKAGTVVLNSKFPERSTAQRLIWPFEFQFEKRVQLTGKGLIISFKVTGEKDMPFMLGYHPAFKIHTEEPGIIVHDRVISLEEVLEAGSRALEVENCNEIVLKDKRDLKIETEGFGHFMLWTEVSGMLCIEPITFYPYNLSQSELHEGFMYLDTEEKEFTVKIIPPIF